MLCSLAEQQHLVVPLGLFSIRLIITSRLVTSSHTKLMSFSFHQNLGILWFCFFFIVIAKLKCNDIFSVPLPPLKATTYVYPYPQIHGLWLLFFQVGFFFIFSLLQCWLIPPWLYYLVSCGLKCQNNLHSGGMWSVMWWVIYYWDNVCMTSGSYLDILNGIWMGENFEYMDLVIIQNIICLIALTSEKLNLKRVILA